MKVLLVIDYINGIAKSGTCAEYLASHPEVLKNTNQLISKFHQQGFAVLFVRIAFDQEYTGLPAYAPNRDFLVKGKKFQISDAETAFIDDLNFQKSDQVLEKKSGDPFCNSGLQQKLKALNATEVIFTGIATDNAILYGANTAMQHGYKVTVISDACGAPSEAMHNTALAIIKRTSAYTVTTTAEFMESNFK